MNIEQALRATVFGRPEDAEADIAQYFAPNYTQVTDGIRSEYAEFVAHIRHVRGTVVSGELRVLDKAREGNVVADRHTVRVDNRDGSTATLEILLIGEVDDKDRFVRVVETTRLLAGDERSAGLGAAMPTD